MLTHKCTFTSNLAIFENLAGFETMFIRLIIVSQRGCWWWRCGYVATATDVWNRSCSDTISLEYQQAGPHSTHSSLRGRPGCSPSLPPWNILMRLRSYDSHQGWSHHNNRYNKSVSREMETSTDRHSRVCKHSPSWPDQASCLWLIINIQTINLGGISLMQIRTSVK